MVGSFIPSGKGSRSTLLTVSYVVSDPSADAAGNQENGNIAIQLKPAIIHVSF